MPGSLTQRSSVVSQADIAADNPSRDERSLTRAEYLEMMFAAASQGIGECPTWMILAFEASVEADRRMSDIEERTGPW
jgi:hypothetical protein